MSARLVRLVGALLVLCVAACTTAPRDGGMVASYQPASGPYPYNSAICP